MTTGNPQMLTKKVTISSLFNLENNGNLTHDLISKYFRLFYGAHCNKMQLKFNVVGFWL